MEQAQPSTLLMFVCVCVCVYVHMCTCVCMSTYVHTQALTKHSSPLYGTSEIVNKWKARTDMYIHTCIRAYIHTQALTKHGSPLYGTSEIVSKWKASTDIYTPNIPAEHVVKITRAFLDCMYVYAYVCTCV